MICPDPNILIMLPWERDIAFEWEELIRAAQSDLSIRTVLSIEDAETALPEADVFMTFGAFVKRDIFEGMERLKWVHAFGTGVDGIADRPGLRRDVIVTATRGIHGATLSECAIMQMLALVRNFPRNLRAQERCEWDRFRVDTLSQKTVGILGVGLVATDLAPRLSALGMTVVGITRSTRPLPGFHRFAPRDNLKAAVADLDFLILLVPLEPATQGIIDAEILAAMKPGSYLVNIARGPLVDEKALIAALQSGHLAGAALDTMVNEPLPPGDELWHAPNVILTPHSAGFYLDYAPDSMDQILTNLTAFRHGRIEDMVNREART